LPALWAGSRSSIASSGAARPLEWVMLGSHVTAQEALQHGLVTSVHAPADLLAAAMELGRPFSGTLGRAPVAQSKAGRCGSAADADLTTARNIGLEALRHADRWPRMAGGHAGVHGESVRPRFPPALGPARAAGAFLLALSLDVDA